MVRALLVGARRPDLMFRSSFALFRTVLISSALVVGGSFAAGCAADTEEELSPVDEASADLVSVNKLLGRFEEGRGRYASLVFSQKLEAGRKVNRFEGKQVVQCVTAPCPQVDVSGKWFARSSTLSLYPENGPRETFKANIVENKLTLDNAQGVRVGELTKAIPAPNDVATALNKHGVPNMKVEIEQAEVALQASKPGVTVSFADAVDKAIELFLTEEDGLRGTTGEFAEDLAEECGGNTDLVRCLANAPRTSIRLQKLTDETAPYGDDAKDAWVFVFYVDDFTDHGYFSVIAKDGSGSYAYSFN
jgi:hypothetical protein